MASESLAVLRRAAVPFLAGAAGAAALLHGLYATATLALLVALWAAALVQQAAGRRAAPPPAPPPAGAADAEERRRLRLLLDLSPAPLVALDGAERLRAVNRAARRLFGAEELIQAPPPGLVAAMAATVPGIAGTARIDSGAGEHAFALVTADIDTPTRAIRVAALLDIEADLKAAESATLRELVQVLGHEITNTLTPIASLSATAAAMLDDPAAERAAIRDAVATVARRAQGLQRFGEAYRDLARLPPPRRAALDMARLVADLAQLFRTRWPEVSLELALPSTMAATGDADQLSQAIWALLQNAAEAGRHVSLAAETTAAGCAVTVGDDGPGIAAAHRETIFRPFYTTKPEGTGVGLALARQIFRAHDGDLRVAVAAGRTSFVATVAGGGAAPPPTG